MSRCCHGPESATSSSSWWKSAASALELTGGSERLSELSDAALHCFAHCRWCAGARRCEAPDHCHGTSGTLSISVRTRFRPARSHAWHHPSSIWRYRAIIADMAQLLVRNLESDVKSRLQSRARRHGRSTEEEVREILRAAVLVDSPPGHPLGSRLALRFREAGLDGPIGELRDQPARSADLE